MMSVSPVIVLIGGLLGSDLAPAKELSTLPVALVIIGTASSVIPMTMLMKRIGRKKTFLMVSAWSILVCLFMSYAISIESFLVVCISTFLFGITVATVMQFRFAAMESTSAEFMPNAASAVLLGGIASAFIGPEIAIRGKDVFTTQYSGSFAILSVIFLVAFFILLNYKNVTSDRQSVEGSGRGIKEISGNRTFWVAILSATVGYVIMSFIMTATPVSMHVMDGYSLDDTKSVIQSHILAMFVPSLFSGWLIRKFGLTKMMVVGLCCYLICVAIAYGGHEYVNYWFSLVLLGLGWNFLFVSGTTLLPRSYRPEEKFKVQALNDFVILGSQAVASLSAGWLVFAVGWEYILLFVVPVIIFQMVIIFGWTKTNSRG